MPRRPRLARRRRDGIAAAVLDRRCPVAGSAARGNGAGRVPVRFCAMLRESSQFTEIFSALMPKLHVITYGCQMNEYDSERAAGLLTQGDEYELTETPADADLILLNTCAIREKAEEKVFSKLGQLRELKQRNPGLMIGVMGCMARLQKDAIQKRAPIVDLVFGSPAIARVGELVERVKRERRPILEVGKRRS